MTFGVGESWKELVPSPGVGSLPTDPASLGRRGIALVMKTCSSF